MSGRAWTPGPWEANHNDIYWTIDSGLDGQIGDACASNYIYRDGIRLADVEAKSIAAANARLIAAAPDMAEAIDIALANARIIPDPAMEGATDIAAIPIDDLEALRAALAKAEASHG